MDLVRDVLDKAIFDRNRREVGRVDGIVLERDRNGLRVRTLDVGLAVLACRLHPAVGRCVEGIQWAVHSEATAMVSVPFEDIESIHREIALKRSLTELEGDDPWTRAQPELTVEGLLGREVLAANNHAIGRLEEFRTVRRGSNCVITAYVIGTTGLLERLGLGVRLLFGLKTSGHVARSDQLDLADHERPRLTCPIGELEEFSV